MNPSQPGQSGAGREAESIADFVFLATRSCLLNLSPKLSEQKISYPQFFLLIYLAHENYLTMSSIARKMGHSTAAATGLVDRMEKLKFAERVHAAEDRRKILVRISDKGRRLVESMRGHVALELEQMNRDGDEDLSISLGAARQAARKYSG